MPCKIVSGGICFACEVSPGTGVVVVLEIGLCLGQGGF